MTKGTSKFVQDANMVENTRARIARELRKLPRVDSQGRSIDPEDTPVVAIVSPVVPTTPGPTRDSLATSIVTVALALGANASALTDSISFINAIADFDPADTVGLTKAVSDAMTANPALKAGPATMRPNPGQGSSARPPAPKPQTVAERISERLAKTPPVDRQGHTL